MSTTNNHLYKWHEVDGKRIACTEKLRVLEQNMLELMTVAQDAFEDGVLMGVDPAQLRQCFAELMHNLKDV